MSRPSHQIPQAYRGILLLGALFSLAFAWITLGQISAHDPWYRNTDMNIHNVADALSLNSGFAPGIVDQPAFPTKFLLALDFRLRNELGLLPVWTVKRFARAPDPLDELPRLVRVGRQHSRLLVFALIFAGAVFVGHVSGRLDCAALAVVLLSGSSGLLFQGLLIRPELLCQLFGGVLALYFAWLGTHATQTAAKHGWLLCAGLAGGFSLLSKLPALYYLAIVVLWCVLKPVVDATWNKEACDRYPARRWAAVTGVLTCSGLLIILGVLGPQLSVLDPVAVKRLRLAAVVIGLLPLLGWLPVRQGVARFGVGRLLDCSVLATGVLASFIFTFGLLGLMMPSDQAALYTGKILNTVAYPDPLLRLFTFPGEMHRLMEAKRFFLETPALFGGTIAIVAVALFRTRAAPAYRALLVLLLLQSAGMVAMMSKRQFLDQYSLFAQVPLLLIWPLALAAIQAHGPSQASDRTKSWPVALAVSIAVALTVCSPFSLLPKYGRYQDDATVPVRDLTITFLYDHDAHPPAYLAAMRQHYPSRSEFTKALALHLTKPVDRH